MPLLLSPDLASFGWIFMKHTSNVPIGTIFTTRSVIKKSEMCRQKKRKKETPHLFFGVKCANVQPQWAPLLATQYPMKLPLVHKKIKKTFFAHIFKTKTYLRNLRPDSKSDTCK